MELLANLAARLRHGAHPENLLYCFVGVLLGTMVGVLPGIGPTATIAMLLPITFNFEPVTALIMLAGIYYGAQYGGSTTAILINLPGEIVLRRDRHRRLPDGAAGAGRAGARHRGARLVLRRHGRDLRAGAVRAAARPRRAEVRAAGVFLADRAGADRLHRAGARLHHQGAGDDRARPAVRHGRAGHLHRHAALHLRRRASSIAASISSPSPSASSAWPRSCATWRTRRPAGAGQDGDQPLAEQGGLPPHHRAGAARHRARLGPRASCPAAGTSWRVRRPIRIEKRVSKPPGDVRAGRDRGRRRRRNRPTTPPRRPPSSRC